MIQTKQPNSRMCFICGVENPVGLKLRIYETGPGQVETVFTAPDHYQGYPGVLHGGIAASLLDELAGRSHMGAPSSPRFMFTAKLKVRYRRNIPTGKKLKIIGRAGKTRGRMAEAWAGIYDENGDLLAEANSLYIDVPGEQIKRTDLNALGWKIYPD